MELSTLKCGSLHKYAAAIVILFTSLNSFSQQAWTQVPSPDPSPTRNMIRDIGGTSSSDVWLVGSFENSSGKDINLLMHWNGSGWQTFPGTDLSITLNDLWSVTAITANDVWAVGAQNNFANTRSQLLHWNGSAWSHTLLPDITGGSFLFSVDAISTNDIWAVGSQAGSPTRPSYTIHYNGSTWTEISAPNAGIFRNAFSSVDGIASNDVWAVGHYGQHYGDFHAMAQHWNGSSWINIPLPAAVTSSLGELYSVTMISSNDVWALGSTLTGGLIMIHWDGTSWSEVLTAGSSGGAIVARGTDVFSVGYRISQWNGTNWTVIDSINQITDPSLGEAISFSNGDIWASGNTYDGVFHTLVYRTANAIPGFVHGNSQTLNIIPNSSPQNIDEMLKVQDADVSQVVIYTLLTPPSHGTVSGLPDTAITSGGFAIPSGVTYMPATGYIGTDQLVVKVSVGPLSSQVIINVNVFSALPVLITNYSVSKTGTTGTMKWSTSSEINASEFVMERSADAINFTAVNRIAAHSSGYNYVLVDPSPLPGWNYYRLQLADRDGRITTFPVKSLNFDRKELKLFTVYPNPVEGRLMNIRLNAAGDCNFFLYDQLGKKLMSRMVTGSASSFLLYLPENLATGVYYLTVVNGKNMESEKIFIR